MEKLFMLPITLACFIGLGNTWASFFGFDPMWIALGLMVVFTIATAKYLLNVLGLR